MTPLNIAIVLALVITLALIVSGIWAMAHGGEFDPKHSTQLMAGRVGMQAATLPLLLYAVYLAS